MKEEQMNPEQINTFEVEDIKKVKATKNGWMVNDKHHVRCGEYETDVAKALDIWFQSNKAEPMFTKEEKIKENRYIRLESIFNQTWLGIQAVIIGKPWMKNPTTIKSQIESYDKLGTQATLMLNKDPDNKQLQAIVSKHEAALAFQFNVNLTMQELRGILEDKIENNDEHVDTLLDKVDDLELTKESLTIEKLNAFKVSLSKPKE